MQITFCVACVVFIIIYPATGWKNFKRTAACRQNLGSIHQALMVYTDDNDGWLPPSGAIAQKIMNNDLPRETLRCPSEREPLPFYYGCRQGIPEELDRIVSPDCFPYIMESKGQPWWEVVEDTEGNLLVSAGNRQPWEYATRHDGSMHVCFIAGNIEWTRPDELEFILRARQALSSETYQTVDVAPDGTVSASNLTPGRYKLVPR
jgi:hypothetical protein